MDDLIARNIETASRCEWYIKLGMLQMTRIETRSLFSCRLHSNAVRQFDMAAMMFVTHIDGRTRLSASK